MVRRFVFISAIVTICAAMLLPVSALAQGSGRSDYALMHMLKQGDAVRYRIVQNISGTRTLPGATQSTPVDCDLTSVIRVRFVKALGNAGMEIAAETESSTLKLPGRAARTLAAAKEPRIYRISSSGKAVEVKGSKTEPSVTNRSILDTAWIESLVILTAFPETGVNAGSNWRLEVPSPLQAGAKAKISAKLEDLKQVREGWIATINETIGAPESQANEADSGVSSSRLDGQITLKFLADSGRMFSAMGTVKADIRTQMGIPGMPKGDLPMGSATSMKVEQLASKFSVETLPPVPVSKK